MRVHVSRSASRYRRSKGAQPRRSENCTHSQYDNLLEKSLTPATNTVGFSDDWFCLHRWFLLDETRTQLSDMFDLTMRQPSGCILHTLIHSNTGLFRTLASALHYCFWVPIPKAEVLFFCVWMWVLMLTLACLIGSARLNSSGKGIERFNKASLQA